MRERERIRKRKGVREREIRGEIDKERDRERERERRLRCDNFIISSSRLKLFRFFFIAKLLHNLYVCPI